MNAPTSTPRTVEYNAAFDLHPRVMATVDGKRVCVASTIGTPSTRGLLTTGQKLVNAAHIATCANDNAMLRFVLGQIISDLPANKDWLDPDLERAARKLLNLP